MALVARGFASLRCGRPAALCSLSGFQRGAAVRHMSAVESYVKSSFPPIPAIAPSDSIPEFVMSSWSSFGDKVAIADGMCGSRD